MKVDLTIPEMLVVAAQAIELKEPGLPFSMERLVIEAWTLYPKTFGMKGYDHPSDNKVIAAMSGEKGLPGRGWVLKEGQKMFSLSLEGRAMGRRLIGKAQEEKPVIDKGLPKECDKTILRLLDSDAWELFSRGQAVDITYKMACDFWGAKKQDAESLLAAIAATKNALVLAHNTTDQIEVILANGRHFQKGESFQLVNLQLLMEKRFHRHVVMLKHRAEESA